ncbi:MAG: hypothetical protein ACOYEL_06905 [Saccharofermentanales bacterium]
MGKCIQCGKETQNQYMCYSADIVGQSVERNRAAKTKTTTTSYGNFQLHQAYVCNECIHKEGIMSLSIVMSFVLLLVGIGLLFLIAFNLPDFFDPFSASILILLGFAALSFGGSYGLFRSYSLAAKDRKTDIRKDDDSKYYSGSFALMKMMQKQNPKRAYFTPSSYASLRKM